MNIQTNKQTSEQTNKQTNEQANKQTNISVANMSSQETTSSDASSQPVKTTPKDALVMAAILKEMGVNEYEPRIINQMVEFAYR